VLALAAGLLVVACGAGASPSPATQSPTPAPLPEASFTGGTASASVELPFEARWAGGWCSRGAGDSWLAVNIGYPNGAEYFGLVVGRSPHTPEATHTAAGGGTFTGGDVVVTWRHEGAAVNVPNTGLVLELAPNLSKGTFRGVLADGTEVGGTFGC
jgi:hypothetical protein